MSASGHNYLPSAGGLFDGDDGDVDDETFLKNARPRRHEGGGASSGAQSPQSAQLAALEAQRQTLVERKRAVEQRTLDSTARSVGILRDSERIGVATAEELLKQREQLENSSRRLDEINANLRFSQKHIDGIKSVFGSLKNYISGRGGGGGDAPRPGSSASASAAPVAPSPLPHASTNPFDEHPSTRLRGLDEGSRSRQQRLPGDDDAGGSKKMNELLEANLGEMYSSITRLKGLAVNLGEEIESQNDLIDDIYDKADRADVTVGKQNKQMNKILGK